MRLTHEKIVHLSHVVVDGLQACEEVQLLQPRNQVRLEILDVIRREVAHEEEVESRARARIASMTRTIAEGSPEWDILFRKYCEEEQGKRRRVR